MSSAAITARHWTLAFAGMTRARSVQLSQKVGEVAVAWLRCAGFEGTAQRGGNARVGGWDIDPDNLAIHADIRR